MSNSIQKAVTTSQLVIEALFAKAAIGALAEDILDLEEGKADLPVYASFTLPTAGWTNGSGVTDYPYYCDLSVTGATANDIATVIIASASQGTALACGLCATNETRAGAIRFFAASAPAAAITGNYILQKTSAASA